MFTKKNMLRAAGASMAAILSLAAQPLRAQGSDADRLQKLEQAVLEQDRKSIEDEVGDLLFAVVNLARKCKLDAESTLQAATDKFVARFNRLEDELNTRGKNLGDVDLAEMDAIWDKIKRGARY